MSAEAEAVAAVVPAVQRDVATEPAADAAASTSPSSTLFTAQPNNSAEAADALELGRALAQSGRDEDLPRAERLLAKSVRLHPCTESMQLLASVQRRRQAIGASGSASSARQAAAAASSVASASSSSSSSSSHSPSSAGVPPRPSAPVASAFDADGAAASVGAGADESVQRGFLSTLKWRRCTVEAPSFLQPPPRPGVPARTWTFRYPAALYIPRAQRRPLLVVWTLVLALLLLRWLSAAEGTTGATRTQSRRSGTESSSSTSSSRTTSSSSRGYNPYGEADDVGFRPSADAGASREPASAHYSPRHTQHSFFSLSNLISLLPLLFFLAPMLQQWAQRQR